MEIIFIMKLMKVKKNKDRNYSYYSSNLIDMKNIII